MGREGKRCTCWLQVEPIHILCIAVKDNGDMEDEKLAKMMSDFCFKHRGELKQKSIRRITFLALNKYVRCGGDGKEVCGEDDLFKKKK